MHQEIIATHPGNQSMDKPTEKEQVPDPRDQGGSNSEDEEINSLVTKLMTYVKVAEAQGENLQIFSTRDFYLKNVGEGRFSDVFKCRDKKTKKEVAVKIFKDTCKKETDRQDIERQVSMLEEISLGNPFSKFNVKFLKQCEHKGRTCLVFERLEQNLIDRMVQWRNLDLHYVRVFAIQLLLALDELKAVNIVHTDIHPGNIMFVNLKEQPDWVKLIDFDMAIKASDAQPGMELQTLEYRAPEIFLGLPFTEAIDVWGVGCTLAFLYLGHNLFSASSEDQMVERIVELLGQPEDHLLRSGKYTQRYFMEDEAADGPTWRLRKPGQKNDSTDQLSCLEDFLKVRPLERYQEYDDMIAFVDLLKQMLHVDGNQRISARQALKHPFITMDHLINHFEGHGCLIFESERFLKKCPALSEYLEDKSANWTPLQEFPVVTTTHWDQEGRIILHGSSSSYTVLERIGEGAFSFVVRCQNRTTKQEVAVKMPKARWKESTSPIGPELSMFEAINARNPASNYIINFFGLCEYHGRTCLIFEMLDRSLEDEIEEHGKMTLRSIRPIAKQLFLALDELKALNIQHKDLHPGNIMFVNKQDQPHRVKLIDFGVAFKDDEDLDEAVDEVVNEVLDQAVVEAVVEAVVKANHRVDDEIDDEDDDKPVYVSTDMSDAGCLLSFLYLGYYVSIHELKIESRPGLPEESESEENESESVHSQVETVSQMSENNSTDQPSSLQDVVHVNSTDRGAESEDLMADEDYEDRIAFTDLLKQMLHVDENQRISPCQALQHPFITMDHLINRFESRDYLDASQAIMNECPVFSTDTVRSSSGCPPDQKSSGSPDGVFVTSSEGVKPTDFTPDVPDENDPDVCPSDGEIPPVSDKDNSEAYLSCGGLRQCFNNEELTARSSEGVKPIDVTPDVPASSGGLRKLLQRIQKFFRRVKKSDGKIPTVPGENNPDVCLSDGEIPPVSDKDNSEACLSGGGLRQCFNIEDLTARSSEGVKPTDFTPDVSASSGGLRKLLKRISRVKNFLCCCLSPNVED